LKIKIKRMENSRLVYLIIQETPSADKKSKIIIPLGIHDSFKASIYQCIQFNILDKIDELKSGSYSTLFDIYIQEMIMNENYLGNTYILLDQRKSDYISIDTLNLYVENPKTGKMEDIDKEETRAFKRVCKNSGISKIIKKYNKVVEEFVQDSEKIRKLKESKIEEEEEELKKKYQADIKAYIQMKEDRIKIPIYEFDRLSKRELKNMSFKEYKKIRKNTSNEFQKFTMYTLPPPKKKSEAPSMY
jgi:hypothetical protein